MEATERPFALASGSKSSVTCEASSRVGTSTSAEGRGSFFVVRSTIGTANASVLPDPVGDLASTSSPASASGRTSSWIRKGLWIERAASASTTGRDTPSSRKDCWDICCSTPYGFEICRPRNTRRRNEKLISPGGRIAGPSAHSSSESHIVRLFGCEHERRTDLQDVPVPAGAADQDSFVAEPVDDPVGGGCAF